MFKKIKNKAFTLIELLAVIVVLAIILVLAVPRVLNVVEKADKEAFRITGEQLVKGAKDRQVIETTGPLEEKTYTIINGAFVGDSIPMTGELPDNGTIHVTREGVTSIAVSDDTWCARKYDDEDNIYVSKDPDCVLHIPEAVLDSCFYFTTTATSATITGYSNACSKDPIIPAVLGGRPVTALAFPSFYCKSISSISIPSSVKNIDVGAFYNNLLTRVTIPNSVISIGEYAFQGNQLTSLTIPNSVISIGPGAFGNNQLPDNQAFIYARNPDGSENLNTIVSYGGAKRDNVVIPGGVLIIDDSSFYINQLTSVTIPNGVTSIGDQAFAYNSLVDVIIPDSVTSIGNSAFSYNQLTRVTIPNSVTSIGNSAFSNNQLTSVTIPNSVTHIGDWAFYYNQLTSVTIPNSVTSIGSYAFLDNQLTSVTIPTSVTSIEKSAFRNNQLTSVTIPVNVSIQTSSISQSFYDTYNPTKAAGTYTAPSQDGVWTKQ